MYKHWDSPGGPIFKTLTSPYRECGQGTKIPNAAKKKKGMCIDKTYVIKKKIRMHIGNMSGI